MKFRLKEPTLMIFINIIESKEIEKGMNQRSLEIARKMLTQGMDEAMVMDMTGLTAEECCGFRCG